MNHFSTCRLATAGNICFPTNNKFKRETIQNTEWSHLLFAIWLSSVLDCNQVGCETLASTFVLALCTSISLCLCVLSAWTCVYAWTCTLVLLRSATGMVEGRGRLIWVRAGRIVLLNGSENRTISSTQITPSCHWTSSQAVTPGAWTLQSCDQAVKWPVGAAQLCLWSERGRLLRKEVAGRGEAEKEKRVMRRLGPVAFL